MFLNPGDNPSDAASAISSPASPLYATFKVAPQMLLRQSGSEESDESEDSFLRTGSCSEELSLSPGGPEDSEDDTE